MLSTLTIIYLIVVNLVAFAAMGIDKSRARQNKWRIPEARLFLYAIIGGSLGAIIGMCFFRHKTKHLRFVLGLPAILLAEAGILLWLWINLF